ncbi:DNA polymerase I [Thermanaeromonas sp. C210]|uniref:DNA polymerase I n=1 Tax=Thermanaeromonas sp. C210 TaxID=2731925 RepID=UPI00155BEA0E|nr:DNA polymerase I [Thermanaeromonas sp. C210]GFN22454.1 DNA polymerase [Thermanaeromonas sp. C210]
MRGKLLLVDGNSVAHRAFHALPLLSNSAGAFTNAVYGFTLMLQKALEEAGPDYVAVAFDHGRVTFRTELLATYKGHRPETAVELRPQFALIKKLLQAWRIATYECEGFEADDLIGTLARQAENKGLACLILTGDRDALQLVSEKTKVMLMRRGISQVEVYDLLAVRAQYGLEPPQLIDVKALMGDASDNIPGVPGIGEKTAVQLVQQFGDLETVLARAGEIKRRKMAENLQAHADQARLAKRLAAIDCRAPVELDLEYCRRRRPDYEALLALFKELQFNSLLRGVLKEMEELKKEEGRVEVRGLEAPRPLVLEGIGQLEGLVRDLAGRGEVALELEYTSPNYMEADLAALALAWEGQTAVLPGGWPRRAVAAALEPLAAGREGLLFHDAKAAMLWLAESGARVADPAGDTMIAGYLLDPTASRHDLPALCLEHLDVALVEDRDEPLLSVAGRAYGVLRLHRVLAEKVRLAAMEKLYREVELPLSRVLAAMERSGVAVDRLTLDVMGEEFDRALQELTEEIYRLAGEEFNINSPRQLAAILFEKLGLPPVKKTKTGFSTDAEVLEELAAKHEIAARLVEYRQIMKLKSTYIDGLKPLINPRTGRLHTSFNQTVTATGRLSSSEPNLQNIPVRLELGRRLRRAFVPREAGRVLLAADYSQIELRIMAHLSGDEKLREAFLLGEDIHARTAAEVFGVSLEEVTPEMRRAAKAVNFGIIYGISDYGLSRDLGISRREAHDYIERYFRRYPKVKAYLEEAVREARETGYVTTLLGRRRYLPDLFSPNHNIRSFGERTARNTPIQGSAADIIKVAMVGIFRRLEERALKTEMILQVHDELIFDVPEGELELVGALVKEEMENAVPLEVPLKVDLKYGPNWYDLKPLHLP